jgi:hypothetical protein
LVSELPAHRLALYDTEHRRVFGANTMRSYLEMLGSTGVADPWVDRTRTHDR